MAKQVLILGASGKIGSHSARAFTSAGWHVRSYDRRAGNMSAAASGADVIVNGLNPPAYHDWEHLVPAITEQVIEAASSSGATVILPGNVYNFGPEGGEWSESTPHTPHTRKGRIREEMEQRYRESGIRTIILRAGNFIVPERKDDVMSMALLRSVGRDKVTLMDAPDAMQAYCYVPDWARAAVLLAEKRTELDPFEDVPFPGHAFTANELRAFLSRELGRPIGTTRFPWWAVTLSAPLWELGREMLEMRYLWDTPHTLSGDKLARLLPSFEATPLEQVLRGAIPEELRPTPSSAATQAA